MTSLPATYGDVRVMESHTEGEPTRVILSGGPDLGGGTMRERALRFEQHHDAFRRWLMLEPRGVDYLVGALLCPPTSDDQVAGVLFFNNVGLLGMCGHGTIGVAVTLAQLGRIQPGMHRLDTPVGPVCFELFDNHRVAVDNVSSWRHRHSVVLDVPSIGRVTGDIAWGGNWFFLTEDCPIPIASDHLPALSRYAQAIRDHLDEHRITGEDGGIIDHVELTAPVLGQARTGRNFVLCPGGAYDRSPCGTGTSAKLACLAADGRLNEGEIWIQESVIGSRFEATFQQLEHGRILPRIVGSAYVFGESTFHSHPMDPFVAGQYRSSDDSSR